MEPSDEVWRSVRSKAHGYLRRFTDPWTRSHCDDLVQETAVRAWHWAADPHDRRCLWGAVRTIARRVRGHALYDLYRERLACQALAGARDDVGPERCYRVAGRIVSLQRLLPCVDRALACLRPADRRLLLDFHAGFCCAELSLRSARSESAVKTRLHRARRRVQKEIEACVRAADDLETFDNPEQGEQR